jgi:uncharacterized membrane protein
MNPDSSRSLETEVVELRARVRRIEEALGKRGVVLEELPGGQPSFAQAAPGGQSAPGPPAPPVPAGESRAPSGPPMQTAPAGPIFASSAAPKYAAGRSLESRIGSQWFNRIGILAVLIGMAWFLKLAIDNHWIGPLGRVLIGLVAGAGLIAWSERFSNRGYRAFSYSLKAIGSGILYLSLWASFSLFHLLPAGRAFALMIVVTAFNGFMAWIQDAELLALYAVVGGLSTPLLLSTGENHEVVLFSYLLLVDIAVLVLVVLRPWSRLLFASFAGTVFIIAGWWIAYFSTPQCARTGLFVACFFLIFALAPRLARIKEQVSGEAAGGPYGWDALALVLLPLANAALGFIAFYGLLDRPETRWAGPWVAAAFAAFYLVLLRLPAVGGLRRSSPVLDSLHLAAAVVFLTIAIPMKAQGRWLTMGWLVEGAALIWVAMRARSILLRVLALGCLALGLVALVAVNPQASPTLVFNQRFLSWSVAIAVFAFVAFVANRAATGQAATGQATTGHATTGQVPELEPDPARSGEKTGGWPTVAALAALTVNALILIAVSLEINSFWSVRPSAAEPSDGAWSGQYELHKMYAQFSFSAWFMLLGAILLAAGFARRSAFLRWQGLILLAVSVGKVFLVDMNALSQGYRILSFLGLGALLLGVSFVYQRDWLDLRGRGQAEAQSGRGRQAVGADAEAHESHAE